ncbi:DUF4297 family anti-phage-associated protein, partial [Listeria booriae]|uniref:DUF4297 family anti-phage-associated protein n=1 Tax=Listeria booriae TaxID=1552123 RepID=UPI001628ECC6
YIIYGHYKTGQNKLPKEIDIEFIKKNFLTYKKKGQEVKAYLELGLDDGELGKFLSQLEINVNAQEFTEQNDAIIAKLKSIFLCSEIEAEYYYNNALRLVKSLSIESEIINRSISRKEFIQKINQPHELFNIWYLKLRGKTKFFNLIKRKYFSNLNISPFARFILVECCDSDDAIELKGLLIKISMKLSKILKREHTPYCPYIYLHNIDEEKLLIIKKMLQSDDFTFIDGHDYKGAEFNLNSICKEPNHYNGIRVKFVNELTDVSKIIERLSNTREIYQFYIDRPFYQNNKHTHVKVPVESAIDVKYII